MVTTLWIDVEDLFEYALINSRPTGIQRVVFEINRSLQLQHGSTGLVRFIRHDPLHNTFRDVEWSEIEKTFHKLTNSASSQRHAPAPGISPHPPARQFIRKLVHRLPTPLRIAAVGALLEQEKANRAWLQLLKALANDAIRAPLRQILRLHKTKMTVDTTAQDGAGRFVTTVAQNDVILVLGAPWFHPDYADLISTHRRRFGIRFALLVHDLIPLRRPEWCDRGLVRLFRSWFEKLLPLCDQVFSLSHATAADVETYAREQGIVLPTPVVAIPVGTCLSVKSGTSATKNGGRLPLPYSYALVVSTIEARKNHLLLFRIWRRLLDELHQDQVPTLVFAGHVGWLVEDLMRQIANTDNLKGKLLIVEDPTDSELTALYEGCLFTLSASFYEGWGLPVTESLAMGKTVLLFPTAPHFQRQAAS